jgi:hypothetical protein
VPIVTITVRKPKTSEFKNTVLDAVGGALVGAGASPNDRFQRVIELDPDNFRFDPTFPDLTRPRTDDFVLIELLLGLGRSVKVKKKIVADTIEALSRRGFDPEHVMIVFQACPGRTGLLAEDASRTRSIAPMRSVARPFCRRGRRQGRRAERLEKCGSCHAARVLLFFYARWDAKPDSTFADRANVFSMASAAWSIWPST